MDSPSRYRYDTARVYANDLRTRLQRYDGKMKKYRRRVTAIDVAVYSVSGVMAGAGIVLSSVTMIAPIAIPIAISAATTVAGVATGITKKLSSCSQRKLCDYAMKHQIVFNAYSKLSELISTAIDDSVLSDIEFSAITQLYNSAVSKLEIENNPADYNSEDESGTDTITSTDRRKYRSGTNQHDIDNINAARIQCELPIIGSSERDITGKIASVS
jgi:hypothetical protein